MEVVVSILTLNIIGNQEVFNNDIHSPLCERYVIATTFLNLCMVLSIGKSSTKCLLLDYFDTGILLLRLALYQVLRLHCLKVLAFPNTSSHLT